MIGDLRNRISIETRSDAPDGLGGFTSEWGLFIKAWAKIEPVSARQEYFAAKTREVITHKITIRARSDLKNTMRITWGTRVFQIKGIRTLEERKRFTEILCEEGVAS